MPRPTALPQHLSGGAFRTRDFELHGLSPGGLRSGSLATPFHGVRTLGLPGDTTYDLCLSYEPLLGQMQVFCSITAASLLGLPLPRALHRDNRLHVGSMGSQGPRRLGVVGHRLPADVVFAIAECGLRVTDAATTWCQIAQHLSREELTAVGDCIVSGRRISGGRTAALSTIDKLRVAVLEHGGKRGAPALRWAIERIRSAVDSPQETFLRLLLVESGFVEPLVSIGVSVDGGASVLHPDLAWPSLRIALEYEGDGHREDKRRFRADIRRRERFEAAGWRVIRVTADDLALERTAFLNRVRAIVATREKELKHTRVQ